MNDYLIHYPSGKTFQLKGFFELVPIGDWLIPMIHFDNKNSCALDQRAIIENCENEIYSPRRNLDGLHPEITSWLNMNSNWANK